MSCRSLLSVLCLITATSNDCHGILNYQSIECLFNHLFRLKTKEHQRSALLALCGGNPPLTSGFPSQRASNTENVSIWWRHNVLICSIKISPGMGVVKISLCIHTGHTLSKPDKLLHFQLPNIQLCYKHSLKCNSILKYQINATFCSIKSSMHSGTYINQVKSYMSIW